jgi:hypothetical protein
MRRYPGLPGSVHQEDRDGARALLWEARGAQILVISCRHSEDRWSIRTGIPPARQVGARAQLPHGQVGRQVAVAS